MGPPYTIGQLSRLVGVPTSTVRYYERNGLLAPDGRSGGNYRLYGAPALERLRFIRAAKANGFTLADISALLDFRDGRTEPCREVQELIQERLGALETRLEQLQHVREELRSSLDRCRADDSERCQVIDELSVESSPAPSRTAPDRSPRKPTRRA